MTFRKALNGYQNVSMSFFIPVCLSLKNPMPLSLGSNLFSAALCVSATSALKTVG
jgi:hypothetical protein